VIKLKTGRGAIQRLNGLKEDADMTILIDTDMEGLTGVVLEPQVNQEGKFFFWPEDACQRRQRGN